MQQGYIAQVIERNDGTLYTDTLKGSVDFVPQGGESFNNTCHLEVAR